MCVCVNRIVPQYATNINVRICIALACALQTHVTRTLLAFCAVVRRTHMAAARALVNALFRHSLLRFHFTHQIWYQLIARARAAKRAARCERVRAIALGSIESQNVCVCVQRAIAPREIIK